MSTGFNLGPFTIHYYGIVIIIGILIALLLISREAARREIKLDFLFDAMPWILVGGVIGARIWHIFTPPQSMIARGISTRYYLTHLLEAIAIWKGGIGIIGAVLGGSAALILFARAKKVNPGIWLDLLAPGLALAQAVGRWGNFINQEVFGLPSNLPWAITIDSQHRLPEFAQFSTYHPLFLYESLWSLLNMAFLLYLGRKYQEKLQTGSLFLIYLIIYGVGRVLLEYLRLDVSVQLGININQAFMALIVIAASLLLVRIQNRFPEVTDQP